MPDAGEAGTVDQASPSWSLGCLILLAAMLIVAAVISVFGLLRDYRPPVTLTASTRDLTGLQDITLTGNGPGPPAVRWSLSGSVQATGVQRLWHGGGDCPCPSRTARKWPGQAESILRQPPPGIAELTWLPSLGRARTHSTVTGAGRPPPAWKSRHPGRLRESVRAGIPTPGPVLRPAPPDGES